MLLPYIQPPSFFLQLRKCTLMLPELLYKGYVRHFALKGYIYYVRTLDISEVVLLQALRDWFPLQDMFFCNFSTQLCLHVLSTYSS
jgi:hypothetical protein